MEERKQSNSALQSGIRPESLCCSARHDTHGQGRNLRTSCKGRSGATDQRSFSFSLVTLLPGCRPGMYWISFRLCTRYAPSPSLPCTLYCTLSSHPPGCSFRGWHTRFAQSCACATRDLRDDDDDHVRTGGSRVPHDPLAWSCLDLLRSCHLTSSRISHNIPRFASIRGMCVRCLRLLCDWSRFRIRLRSRW